MTFVWKRRRMQVAILEKPRRQWFDNGLFVHWESGGLRRAGVVGVPMACSEVNCPCSEVVISCHAIDETCVQLELSENELAISRRASASGQGSNYDAGSLQVVADYETRDVILRKGAIHRELEKWLPSCFDDRLFDWLHQFHMMLKGFDPAAPDPKLEFERPDSEVTPFDQFFPWSRRDAILLGSRRVQVFDAYELARPREARIDFFEETPDERDGFLGHAILDLSSSKPRIAQTFFEELPQEDAKVLVAQYLKRHPQSDWFLTREELVRQFDLEPEPIETLPSSSSPKVGRNAPCPCGSGKKYKKCCML